MNQNNSDHKEQAHDSEPAMSKHPSTDTSNPESSRQEEQAQRSWKQWYKNPEYVFSCFIALFTVVLAVTSYLQWEATKDNLRTSERAWVTLTSANLEKPMVAGEKHALDVEIQNSGKSPAIDLIHILGTNVYDRLPKDTDPMPDLGQGDDGSHAVLGPGAKAGHGVYGSAPLTKEMIERIQNKKSFLLGVGRIRYRDIFDRPHTTTYCMFLRIDATQIGFSSCPAWNHAD